MLDYILHSGSENVVIYFKDNLYIIKCVPSCLVSLCPPSTCDVEVD